MNSSDLENVFISTHKQLGQKLFKKRQSGQISKLASFLVKPSVICWLTIPKPPDKSL